MFAVNCPRTEDRWCCCSHTYAVQVSTLWFPVCPVPGCTQAAGTHMCHKIVIIRTLKWTGVPQDRSIHKTDVYSVAPCVDWAFVSTSNDCGLQKFAKVSRILGISVPHTPSWLCRGKVPLCLCQTFTSTCGLPALSDLSYSFNGCDNSTPSLQSVRLHHLPPCHCCEVVYPS